MENTTQNRLIDRLKSDLTEGRFVHSLGVAECARALAVRFDCDAERAYIAGLLHDCATKLSGDEMLALALEVGLRAPDEVSANPVADYHARLGAVVARRDYGIDDPAILSAIACHQIGGVPMTTLDMIVSLADAIEPSRKGAQIDAIRAIAETDLLQAYIEKCKLYMTNILQNNQPLGSERVAVYNYLLTLLP